ncbi:MAG: hypothetical protein IJ035_10605 [Oscillospiraceae bacterium]|nr:hypothetical protein [Oscillospiraceae bacterium]
MAFWNKPQDAAPAPSPAPVSSPAKFVDADDFFKDMGRKPKLPKDLASIETPEVTGLREEPAPVPECTLADYTNEINTDGLIDKAALDDGQYHGYMEDRPTDEEVAAKEAAAARKAAANQPAFADPDDFFKGMGRKKAPKELAQIETPDVVGLREGPAPVAECTLADFTAEINTDGLIDKAALDDGQYHGYMDEA